MTEPSSKIMKWIIIFRAWSFTATAVPVILGTVWAWSKGYFNFWLFLLTLLGGVAIHAGTNLTNTYYDFINGVDTIESEVKSNPALVAGWMKPKSFLYIGLLSFLVAFLIGVYFFYLRGWPIFIVGLIGIAGGYEYTGGVSYKYKGTATMIVFILMGPLMVWGPYFIQTGLHDWSAVLISLPIGFLVAGILHSNDLRDLEHDKKAGIKTFPVATGNKIGLQIYYFLYSGAFLSVFLLSLFKVLSIWPSVTILLVAPLAIQMMKHAKEGMAGSQERLDMLEMEAAQMDMKFGLLYILGVVLGILF
ncbi:1,4-dihydroxy-2-naphthoate octaprenyltransferase [Tepidibacillus marianensis]|uniref:1,4-dihydroxy-2-naphthoate octaprenyltransferase n=1 Tax=Tepidibacillus marianensis TaxID=3131995 RepID=UPI0030CD4EAC